MWTVVHIAPSRVSADQLKARLESEGLLVMVRPVEALTQGGDGHFELLVPEAEAEEAHEILNGAPRQ
ncbi:MAG: hypothetical protein ACM3RP_04870 [Chitinophagales bacterium]